MEIISLLCILIIVSFKVIFIDVGQGADKVQVALIGCRVVEALACGFEVCCRFEYGL